jgi:hypothetical protein
MIAVAGAVHTAGAQGIPALGAAKRAANNAANATNASIAEQTGQPVTRARGTGTANTNTANATSTTAAPAGTNAGATSTTAAAQLTTKTGPGVPPGAVAKGAQPATTKDTTKAGAKPAAGEVAFSREVFSYDAAGRRDPFLSLLASGDLRPSFTDLKLVAVAYDPTGRKSVAVMRDVSSKDQYRVKVGQTLGRMRVAQIHPKSVTFTIDEFGYSRQEILALGDSTTRNP